MREVMNSTIRITAMIFYIFIVAKSSRWLSAGCAARDCSTRCSVRCRAGSRWAPSPRCCCFSSWAFSSNGSRFTISRCRCSFPISPISASTRSGWQFLSPSTYRRRSLPCPLAEHYFFKRGDAAGSHHGGYFQERHSVFWDAGRDSRYFVLLSRTRDLVAEGDQVVMDK